MNSISNLKDPTLPTSIWNQPFDGPKTLRIGVLKIVDSKVKSKQRWFYFLKAFVFYKYFTYQPILVRTDDEVIQTSHHYAKTKQYFVEQIFANSGMLKNI